MNFLNRFYFFGFGILLGVLILFLSINTRKTPLTFDYFPNSRVKKYLIQNKILFSKDIVCKMNCYNLDTAFLNQYILNSDVDFKKSKIRGYNFKTYYLSFESSIAKPNENSYLVFQTIGDSITLIDVFSDFSECNNCH